MTGRTDQRFIWAFGLALAVLLGVGLTAYRSLERVSAAAGWRDHTKEVLSTLDALLLAVMDVETSQRGFLLSGKEEYLDPFHQGMNAAPTALTDLERLTQDNPVQQERLRRLRVALQRKLDRSREVVVTRRRQGFDGAQAMMVSGEGKLAMDEIRSLVEEMERDERALLTTREATMLADEGRTAALVIGGNALALAVVVVAAFFLVRNARDLRSTLQTIRAQEWLQSGLAALAGVLREERPVDQLGGRILERLGEQLGAPVGALYRLDPADGTLVFSAGRALAAPRPARLAAGETLVGEAVRARRIIELGQVPAGYLTVASGTGRAEPGHLLVLPLLYHDQVEGVIELAWLAPPPASHRDFLERASESIAVALATARSLVQVKGLLATAQQQGEELRVQQEQLSQINAELEEQTEQLSLRSTQAEDANTAIERARAELQQQAEQLALSSKYKSEFLSNMSHELRTPLNSLLILSQQLYENPAGNLSEKQVHYARTINGSGHDLLALINDILDLAKIESGTVRLDTGEVRLGEVREDLDRLLRPLAEQKGLAFTIRLGAGLPAAVHTDRQRLLQVLKNLLANAIKFTASGPGRQGVVTLSIDIADSGWSAHHPRLGDGAVLALAVSDNGIGIAEDQQALVFQAFRQADGGVARRFGGTGLGLSISRELATLLGGELRLVSTLGQGSTFTLYLPLAAVASAPGAPVAATAPPVVAIRPAPAGPPQPMPPQPALVDDDRALIVAGDRVLLIVEDDHAFARILVELAREQGFKAVVSLGGAGVTALARELAPDAITLDIHLGDANGWHLLDRLKHDPSTRHIPVHVITVDEERQRALRQGAHGILTKPASRETLARTFHALRHFRDEKARHLLVVEDDQAQRDIIVETIGNDDVLTTTAVDAEAALAALAQRRFDCIVLDLGLPHMSGQHLLDVLHEHPEWRDIPVIVYTARDLSSADEQQLRRSAKTIVMKTASSLDRLLDETALFLHRVHSRLPAAKRQRIERIHQADSVLTGKTVLVADDDVRNVFALTSLLERYHMTVVTAENGREALARLAENPAIALVLMDVMMPEMDGYAAMRAIRAQAAWRDLPVLALTAKAMKGDRELCLAAGASDYITKPVDSDQLLSMLRVWLYR